MYQHVVVPLDGSELAECVLPHVEAVATGCSVSRVTLVRVITPIRLYGGVESHISPEERHRLEKDSMKLAATYLEEKAQSLREAGVVVDCMVLFGNVVEELVDYLEEHEADLVVIATHGRSGVSRLFLGSVADRVLRASPVPVLMVRAPGSEARTV